MININRRQVELAVYSLKLIAKKTLTVIFVGVFLFTGTFGWAKEEGLFSTAIENKSFSSRLADNNKLAPWSRLDVRGFKDSLTVAAICKHIEHDGNLDDKSYLNDVLARLDAGKNPNITVLPYEIIIEIPGEGLAVRYFDPIKANVITPYSDISKLSTKIIGPLLSRQIIHRVRALQDERSTLPESAMKAARQVFDNPQTYRDMILRDVRVNPVESYDGKGLICFFLTKFCPVGCRRCFYNSPPPKGVKTQEDTFTDEGVTGLINFIRDANIGYLLVAGGGDPFVELKSVCRITAEASADIIVLVTSGFWAKNMIGAERVVDKIYEAFKKRTKKARIILRISVDNDHVEHTGMQPILNLIDIFQRKFKGAENFELQIHTMFNDSTIDEMLRRLPVRTTSITTAKPIPEMISTTTDDRAIKISGKEMKVTLESGFSFIIGFAKFFYTDWRVNLNDRDIVERNTRVYDKDMAGNQNNNTAVVFNTSGKKGLDFFINHDGNVMSWGCNSPDNKLSLYDHDARTIRERLFADVISLSFIEKGIPYRDAILNEVNPKAVTRTKAINMRDFAGNMINEEAKTRLYLSIRVIQDYVREGRIALDSLPPEIRQLVSLSRETLIRLYHESDYSIIDQRLSEPGVPVDELIVLYDLITLGHYDVTPQQMIQAVQKTVFLTDAQREEFFTKIELRNDQNVRQFGEWVRNEDYDFCRAFLQKCIEVYGGNNKDTERIFKERYLSYILTNAPPARIMGLRAYLHSIPALNEIALIIAEDTQYELEQKLNSSNSQERKMALRELSKMIEYGIVEYATQVEESNIHIHSKYSYSPYYPEAIAYWSRRAGLRDVGIMDHDTADGIPSFVSSAQMLKLRGISGIELRGNLTGTPIAGHIFNASDMTNIIYVLCQGLALSEDSPLARTLGNIQKAKERRYRAMTKKINDFLASVNIGLTIDYDSDIISLTENGNCVDRHLTLGLANKINAAYLGKAREEIYAKIMGKEALSDSDRNAILVPEEAASLLRYSLLKPTSRPGTKVSCLILPDEAECPPLSRLVSEIKASGGITIYPYPEPAEASRDDEERSLRRLFPYLKSIEFLGVEIMTNRLSEEYIDFLIKLAREYGLKIFTYRDVNKLSVPFVQDKARVARYPQTKTTADFLAGHEFLARHAACGYYSLVAANILPDEDQRFGFFAYIGSMCCIEREELKKELEGSKDKKMVIQRLVKGLFSSEAYRYMQDEKADFGTADRQKGYLDRNKELFSSMLGADKPDALVRVPIEAIESVGIDNIKDFLATFQEAPSGYIELYYMSGRREVSESVYQKYDLQKKSLPKDFRRTRENTVTLFPAFKGEDLSKFSKSDICTRLGSIDINPENTILSPIGLQHDPAGLIRATIFGLKIMNIARQIREKGVDQAFKDSINQEILHELRNVCDAEDFNNFNLTPDDIIALAAGNINNILAALKKLIKLLPITPIDSNELRQIYEHAKAVITAA